MARTPCCWTCAGKREIACWTWFWVWTCAVPAVGFTVLVGVAGSLWTLGDHPQLLVWILILPVLWQFLYAQRCDALLALRSRAAADV